MEGSRDKIVLMVRLTRPLDRRLITEALEQAGAVLEEMQMAPEHEHAEAA